MCLQGGRGEWQPQYNVRGERKKRVEKERGEVEKRRERGKWQYCSERERETCKELLVVLNGGKYVRKHVKEQAKQSLPKLGSKTIFV